MRIVLVVLLCSSSCTVFAQDAHRLEIEGCAIDDLEAAIALEVGELSVDSVRAIHVACAEGLATISIDDAELGLRVERRVELGPIEPHLHARTIALVAGELASAARRLVVAPEPPPPPPPPPDEIVPPEIVPPVAPPPASGVVLLPPARARPWELSLLGGIRLYPLETPTTLGDVELGLRYEWLLIAVRAGGTRVEPLAANIDGVSVSAAIGAAPFVHRESRLEAGLALFIEGGFVWTSARSTLEGYRGTDNLGGLVGGFARVWGSYEIADRVDLRASVDVGYDYGVEVFVLDDRVASVHGLFIGVHAGVAWAP